MSVCCKPAASPSSRHSRKRNLPSGRRLCCAAHPSTLPQWSRPTPPAAIAPDYVQRMWPNSYGGRRKLYDYEGLEPTALPPAGYIWNNVLAKGLTFRNFGYFVNLRQEPGAEGRQIETVRDPSLAAHTN